MSLLSAFLKHAKFSVAFGRLGTAFVIAAALSAGALTSNCALAASDDGWFSAIDAGRGEKKAGPHVTVDIIAEKTSLTPQAVNPLCSSFPSSRGLAYLLEDAGGCRAAARIYLHALTE